MRVAFWATTFQADTQAMACHLAAEPGVEVMVAMPKPDAYAAEPIHRFLPLSAQIVDRDSRDAQRRVKDFAADVLIVDNHLPSEALAPRLYVLWHGFGWRVDDLSRMRKELTNLVGDVSQSNPKFRWHAVGNWDRDYRIHHSGFAPDNVLALGAPYSDLLLPESGLQSTLAAADLSNEYTIAVRRRKTVLFGLTWHHGGAFGQWGDEASLLAKACEQIGTMNANVLLRMHDRHRYESSYQKVVDRISAEFPHVQVKYKNEHPDSLLDLSISDVAVSNYSSLLNHFYYTGRPSVHIDPTPPAGGKAHYRELKWGFVTKRTITNPEQQWKLSPDEIGGVRVQSFEALLRSIEEGLRDPTCCTPKAKAFTDRYVTQVDGGSRVRTTQVLRRWTGA